MLQVRFLINLKEILIVISKSQENKPERESSDVHDTGDTDSQPEHVTENAHLGLQKAEAVALVWGKKVVWCTYAW